MLSLDSRKIQYRVQLLQGRIGFLPMRTQTDTTHARTHTHTHLQTHINSCTDRGVRRHDLNQQQRQRSGNSDKQVSRYGKPKRARISVFGVFGPGSHSPSSLVESPLLAPKRSQPRAGITALHVQECAKTVIPILRPPVFSKYPPLVPERSQLPAGFTVFGVVGPRRC